MHIYAHSYYIGCSSVGLSSHLKKSPVVDESLSVFKPMFCFGEYFDYYKCNLIFLVILCYWHKCQNHVTPMASLMAPLHSLGKDDQNEVQCVYVSMHVIHYAHIKDIHMHVSVCIINTVGLSRQNSNVTVNNKVCNQCRHWLTSYAD